MKAVVVENYDSIDGISIKEMDLPDVAPGQVRHHGKQDRGRNPVLVESALKHQAASPDRDTGKGVQPFQPKSSFAAR